MRLLAMSLLFCAALTTGGFAAERISPAAGQTIEEFEAANDAELTATPGNKIGYTVQKCPLKPPPFGSTEVIFIGYGRDESRSHRGARRQSHRVERTFAARLPRLAHPLRLGVQSPDIPGP